MPDWVWITYVAVAGVCLFGGITATFMNAVFDGLYDSNTVKAARATLLSFVWPLVVVGLMLVGLSIVIGKSPKEMLSNRKEKKYLEELQRRKELADKIASLEHELGI